MPQTAKINGREAAKKNAHKDEQAAVGHNSSKAPEVDQTTFLYFLGRQKEIEEELSALKAKKKKLRRQARDEGIVLADMDAMLRLEALGDDAVEEHFRNQIQYARYMRLPVGTQLGFFDEEVPEAKETTPEKSKQDGRAAGLRGSDLSDNPHEMNTKAGQGWAEGWHDGQKELAEQLKMRQGAEGPLQ